MNKKLKYLLVSLGNLLILGIGAYLSNYILTLSQFPLKSDLTTFMTTHLPSYRLGILLCGAFILLLSALFGDIMIATGIFGITSVVLGFINRNKLTARQAPFYPEEMKMAGESKSLMQMVDKGDLLKMAAVLFIILVGMIVLLFLKKKFHWQLPRKVNFISRGILLLLALLTLIPLNQLKDTRTPFWKWLDANHQVDVGLWGWNQPGNYHDNGFVLGFAYNMIPQNVIEKPKDYSKEAIEEIVKKYQKNTTDTTTKPTKNIVLVLSESFTDPSDLNAKITWQQDPIANIHNIMKETNSGHIVASEYGGGTANMEFELLTGFSTQLLKGIPFQNIVPKRSDMPSFIKNLKALGYETTAIHPFDGNMYKRSSVYPNLGIDTFSDEKTIKHQKKIAKSGFISDEEAYSEALDTLKQSDKPLFLNLVTMQNHQPYGKKYDEEFPFTTKTALSPEETLKIGTYVEGLHYTDLATKDFLAKLKTLPQDTVVLFYGDHYPGQNVYEKFYFNDIGDYKTPYFIYDTSGKTIDHDSLNQVTSLNYIQLQLNEFLGITNTPFQNLLADLQKEWPALSRRYSLNNQKKAVLGSDVTGKLYDDYQMIAYDFFMGKNYSSDLGFYNH